MRRWAFVVFVVLALIGAGLTVGGAGTYKIRELYDFFVSDSDTVLTTRKGLGSDSLFVIGGLAKGEISGHVYFVPFGDSAMIRVIWYYGNEDTICRPETLLDTSMATTEIINEVLVPTNTKAKWAYWVIEDSIDVTAGDSTKLGFWSFER